MNDKFALPSSPSLLHNNLSELDGKLMYCHLSQAVSLDMSTPSKLASVYPQEQDTTVQQACLLQLQDKYVAVLVTSKGMQLWDFDTQQQLYSWDLHLQSHSSSPQSFCRGLAQLQVLDDGCVLCVGSDAGIIHTFETSNMSNVQHNYDIIHHDAPIAALTSSNHILASSDDHGAVTVFHAKSHSNFQVVHSWEGRGVPCVSVAVKQSTLICAFYDGSVRLHSLVDGMVKAVLQAHSRLLAAMTVHPTRPLFATAAEDATVAVWMLSDDQSQVRPWFSSCWNNSLLVGLAFTGTASTSIAVAAYDTDEIGLWAIKTNLVPRYSNWGAPGQRLARHMHAQRLKK